jgi:hypothetical protein
VTDTLLALWEQSAPGSLEAAELTRTARQACDALSSFGRVFPSNQPRALICKGRYEWQAGHRVAARRAWQRGLALAERIGLPYAQALAHDQLGRHAAPGTAERQTHLARAHALFEAMQARYDMARVEAEQAESSPPEG